MKAIIVYDIYTICTLSRQNLHVHFQNHLIRTFIIIGLGLFQIQQYFRHIVVVSFIGGGNRSTQRKPPIYHKSLTNFIT